MSEVDQKAILDLLFEQAFNSSETLTSEDAIGILVNLESLITNLNEDLKQNAKKILTILALKYLSEPEVFQNYVNDSSHEYNEANHLLSYAKILEQGSRLPILNGDFVVLRNVHSFTLFFASLFMDPGNFSRLVEHHGYGALHEEFLIEKIIEAVENYGIPLNKHQSKDPEIAHVSGLLIPSLKRYIEDDGISIYQVLVRLFQLDEIKKSRSIILNIFKNVSGNSENWKNEIFGSIKPELLDDETYIFQVAKFGVNNWGIPFENASQRIKNDKRCALWASALDGWNIFEFHEKFLLDREVVIVALSKTPEVYDQLPKVMQADPYLYDLCVSSPLLERSRVQTFKKIYENLG